MFKLNVKYTLQFLSELKMNKAFTYIFNLMQFKKLVCKIMLMKNDDNNCSQKCLHVSAFFDLEYLFDKSKVN